MWHYLTHEESDDICGDLGEACHGGRDPAGPAAAVPRVHALQNACALHFGLTVTNEHRVDHLLIQRKANYHPLLRLRSSFPVPQIT
jgi:hypothetical protein